MARGSDPRARPTPRLPPDERRGLIYQAALEVFAENGFRAASMDQIAARAGVTKPIVYRHAESKTALYVDLLDLQIADLLARVAAAVDQEAPQQERLRAGIAAFFAYVADQPFARRLIFRDPEAQPEIRAAHDRVQAVATGAIAALLAGEPNLLAGDPGREEKLAVFAEAIKSGLNGLADWWQKHPETSADDLVATATDLYFAGLDRLSDA